MSEKKKKSMRRREDERSLMEDILDFVKVFALSAIVILLFVNFVAHPVTVVGHSMDPTLAEGEYGFTNVLGLSFSGVDRGDIVVLTMEDENGETSHWVKRIIGLPGETIECRDGQVYINGVALDESDYLSQDYIDETLAALEEQLGAPYGNFTSDFEAVTLGDDEYYVMGDNRPYSKDSRYPDVGPVKGDALFGKGILVLFPLSEIGVN